jgi:hemoglobin-like flavoprotein
LNRCWRQSQERAAPQITVVVKHHQRIIMPTKQDQNGSHNNNTPSLQSLLNAEQKIRPSLADARAARPQSSGRPSLITESSKRYLEFAPVSNENDESTVVTTLEGQISKVEQSWYLISDKIERVGLILMLNLFHEQPQFLKLFPFEGDYEYDAKGRLMINSRMETHLRAHAAAVMRVVGTCVAGLTSMDDLVPKLRRIGSTHRQAGVQDWHYEIMYRHLISTLRDEIGSRWDQETEDAWQQAFGSISDLMRNPSTRLETEPLEGWGITMAIACLYLMIFTPFRLAGFLYGRFYLQRIFDFFDVCAALAVAADLGIDFVQSKLKRRAENSRLVRQLVAIVRRLEPWCPWPGNDIKVLLSFVCQCLYRPRPDIGLHWTHLLGLIRVATGVRVLHFIHCAENKALFDRKLDASKQGQIRMAKLLSKLCFITHLSACLWCIVARFQLGADATEVKSSLFFPDTDILLGSAGILNSYMRAVHWAFVNLAGIGNVDSQPETTLECFVTILTHICGAVFYAIVTGNVIKMLEEASERDNKIGTDIAKLTSYMDAARVSSLSKERIMKGYMMRNVLTKSKTVTSTKEDHLDPNDDVLSTLPSYLRQEVAIYARAELIRRRDRFFSNCSEGFLVALSSSLLRTRTLLTGDYLLKCGETYEREFIMVESGSLQIQLEHNTTIKTLERGDVVGKGWLFHSVNGSRDSDCNEYTDWCFGDRTAGLSIRALCPCTILCGLTNEREIEKLEQGYKADFDLLGAQIRKATKTEAQRRASTFRRAALNADLFKGLRSFADRQDGILTTVEEDEEEVHLYSEEEKFEENGVKLKTR